MVFVLKAVRIEKWKWCHVSLIISNPYDFFPRLIQLCVNVSRDWISTEIVSDLVICSGQQYVSSTVSRGYFFVLL